MYRLLVSGICVAAWLFAGLPQASPDAVQTALLSLPAYSVFDHLEGRIVDGTVVLDGHVSTPGLREAAEVAVKQVKGVASVVNDIENLPLSAQDEQLRKAVYQAIYTDPVLSLYSLYLLPPIHILLKDGNVVLEGTVSDEAEKMAAEKRAGQVPGVLSITNHLTVKPGGQSAS